MNWLAHVLLSEPDIEFRLGNLLADLIKGRDRGGMPDAFVRGTQRHQAIDKFTDSHPVVHCSMRRLGDGYPHANGILVDIFYDHFLALDWDRYCAEPLAAFTARLYADIRAHPIALPTEAQAILDRMIAEDRLTSYRTIEGIEAALLRLSQRILERTGRDLALERAVSLLVANFDDLRDDFATFFPELQNHVVR